MNINCFNQSWQINNIMQKCVHWLQTFKQLYYFLIIQIQRVDYLPEFSVHFLMTKKTNNPASIVPHLKKMP